MGLNLFHNHVVFLLCFRFSFETLYLLHHQQKGGGGYSSAICEKTKRNPLADVSFLNPEFSGYFFLSVFCLGYF